MKIILEGPDNGGKTTLARKLGAVIGVRYFHPGGAPASKDVELDNMLEQYSILTGPQYTVLDRITAVSQQVYNPDAQLEPVRQQYLQMMMQVPYTILVYCRPSNEFLADVGQYTWRPEETEEHRQKIITRAFEWIQRYDAIMSKVPCVHFNFTDAASSVIESRLIGALQGQSDAAMWLHEFMLSGGRR